MKDVQRQTRSHLLELFRQHGLNPRGDLGQNFLIDVNLIEFVVRHGDPGPQDVVLEVGTGTGGMTAFLARGAGHVVSVDIDRNMSALAAEAVQGCRNVTLVNEDILKNKNTLAPAVTTLLCQLLATIPGSRLKLIANLPYSVGTPVISNLMASDLPWERMVCTIQWELAEKMSAEAGRAGYGALSVWIQSQATVRVLRRPRAQSLLAQAQSGFGNRKHLARRPSGRSHHKSTILPGLPAAALQPATQAHPRSARGNVSSTNRENSGGQPA
jgi:16S rRNA (adenine1518-N6/adenine1519-N6)-dimethyltransferase